MILLEGMHILVVLKLTTDSAASFAIQHHLPGVRADGLSPKYWIIPENCQKIYFSKHLEVGGGPAQKLETHLSGD